MTTASEASPETIQFMYDYGRALLTEQMQNIRALDTKIVQVFAASGVGLGVSALARGMAPGNRLVDVLLTAAVVAYLAVAWFTWRHLRPCTYEGIPEPGAMWRASWKYGPDAIRHQLITDIAAAYDANQPVSDRKAALVRRALGAAAVEFFLIGLAVAVGRWV